MDVSGREADIIYFTIRQTMLSIHSRVVKLLFVSSQRDHQHESTGKKELP